MRNAQVQKIHKENHSISYGFKPKAFRLPLPLSVTFLPLQNFLPCIEPRSTPGVEWPRAAILAARTIAKISFVIHAYTWLMLIDGMIRSGMA